MIEFSEAEQYLALEGNKGDATLGVRFEMRPVEDKAKTAEAGHPVYVDREYVDIRVPGDKTLRQTRPATDADRRRFPRQYSAFRRSEKGEALEGQPLREWPRISRSQVEELAYHGILTVEQLAAASDANLSNTGPHLALRQAARDHLAAARETAGIDKLRAKLDDQDSKIAALTAQLEASKSADREAANQNRKGAK